MEKKLSLSIILPIKSSLEKDFSDFFTKAIESIKIQPFLPSELIIVHTAEEKLIKYLDDFDFGDINTIKILWDSTPNYCEQVNLGIKNSTSEWVSLFEFDDEYSGILFKNFSKYVTSYPNVDIFLPVVVDTDEKNMFAGFTNEATFAANFTQEMGYLTNDTLHNYQNFQTSGSMIRKKVFENFGYFKPSLKLTFIYELLLRFTYNSVQIMSIPKIGYRHINMRENSLFWGYKFGENKLSDDEVKFWIQTAKKEYFFTDDRVIKYEPENA